MREQTSRLCPWNAGRESRGETGAGRCGEWRASRARRGAAQGRTPPRPPGRPGAAAASSSDASWRRVERSLLFSLLVLFFSSSDNLHRCSIPPRADSFFGIPRRLPDALLPRYRREGVPNGFRRAVNSSLGGLSPAGSPVRQLTSVAIVLDDICPSFDARSARRNCP
ncbi:hypothetical protein M432DRAFT_15912 [Thermoascus aurantiacus ATCC 26904]